MLPDPVDLQRIARKAEKLDVGNLIRANTNRRLVASEVDGEPISLGDISGLKVGMIIDFPVAAHTPEIITNGYRWLCLNNEVDVPPGGMVRRTVGNSTSGADAWASEDAYEIFAFIWDNFPQASCTLLDETTPQIRGDNALADFNEGYRLQLPDRRDRFLIGFGEDRHNMGEQDDLADALRSPLSHTHSAGTLDSAAVTGHQHDVSGGGNTGEWQLSPGTIDHYYAEGMSTPDGTTEVQAGTGVTVASAGHHHNAPAIRAHGDSVSDFLNHSHGLFGGNQTGVQGAHDHAISGATGGPSSTYPPYQVTAWYILAEIKGAIPGIVGPQGAQGWQGSGSQGYQGPTGSAGPQGATGSTGFQGAVGGSGFQGAAGSNGAQGAAGSNGAAGPQGATGGAGAAGAQGPAGSNGAAGAQGATGAQGAAGAQGRQGFQGVAGTNGAQGATGPQGNQGNQGRQGFQGPIGYQGATGFQGRIGYQGATGSGGPQGAQGWQGQVGTGAQGPAGGSGAQGNQGNQGVAGTTVLVALKTADESVASSTVLQDDDALTLSIASTGNYFFELKARAYIPESRDMKVAFSGPAVSASKMETFYEELNNSSKTPKGSYNDDFTSELSILSDSNNEHLLLIKGYFVATGTGTLTFRWAQNSSGAAATIVRAGAWLRVTKV